MARLRGMANPAAERMADYERINAFIRLAHEAADTIASLIAERDATDHKHNAELGEVERDRDALLAERDWWRNQYSSSADILGDQIDKLEAERDTAQLIAKSRLTDLEAFKAYSNRLEAERDKLKEELNETHARLVGDAEGYAEQIAKLVERVSVLEKALREIEVRPLDGHVHTIARAALADIARLR